MELLKNLNWRYATKQFDTKKKVPETQINKIKEAVRLSPSSFGLQPYQVIEVKDPAIRERLKAAAWGQNQVTDASHFFVFCSFTEIKDEIIDELFDLKSKAMKKDKADFDPYISFIKGKVAEKSKESIKVWNSRQAYIGLSNLIAASAELRIDACPMEGFDPKQVNDILDLNSQGLNAVVLAAVGYRSDEDQTQHFPKVRKPLEQLFKIV